MKPHIALVMIVLSTAFLISPASAEKAGQPAAWVELGPVNVENGLSMPDAADGRNEPAMVGGSKCRVNSPENSAANFMYFDYDTRAGRLLRPIYVTVEYFDEGFGAFLIQYDSSDLAGPERGAYKSGAAEILLDSRKWRKATFELTDARFGGRQEMEADFRLVCRGRLAVRKVSLEFGRSENYKKQTSGSRDRVAASVGRLTPPRGVEVVFGGIDDVDSGDPSQIISDLKLLAPMFKALGVTSVQTTVTWASVEPSRGHWDWVLSDQILDVLRANDLKWTPRLVIGPAYATPKWFRDSEESVFATCLEHNTTSLVQSVWNPEMAQSFEFLVGQFAQCYGGSRSVESVLLGVSGDTGETVYPVSSGDSGESYHSHLGYWCGDTYARADYRRYLALKYGDVRVLNAAWKSSFESFDVVNPSPPDANESPRRRLDFVGWYRDRMTEWAALCMVAARKALPSTEIYLCTGSDGHPAQGVDFRGQCKAAAEASGGVRLTSDASGYPFDFAVTSLATSAAKFYDSSCALQPPGDVSTGGIAARVFNFATSRSSGICLQYPTVLIQPGGIETWTREYHWLSETEVRRPLAAVLFPRTALMLKWGGFYEKVMQLRDAMDFDLVDETMIRDGALEQYRVLVLIEGKVLEREDIDRIMRWIESGGIVVACDFGGFATVESDSEPFQSMFDTSKKKPVSRKTMGAGLSFYVPVAWGDRRGPAEAIARVLHSLSTGLQHNLVPDGLVDGVYMSDSGGRLLALNTNEKTVERNVRTAIGRRKKVSIPPGTIVEITE